MLEALVNKTAPQNLVLKLFKTNVAYAETNVAGDYTEADFTGYSSVTLTGSSWGAASGGAPSSIAFAQQSFISSADQSAQTIYGVMLVQATSGLLVAVETFSSGQVIQNDTDTIKYTPVITGKDEGD